MPKATKEITKQDLNPQQLLFCELYSSDREFFGNGTQAYIEAYNIDVSKKGAYKVAQASASRLLSNAIVLEKINELLELRGLNDEFVDKQLEFLVTQNADFKTKLGAIKEYNVLKTRTAKAGEGGNVYNTFVQQNNLNPNTPEAKTLVENTLDILMAQTKRKRASEENTTD